MPYNKDIKPEAPATKDPEKKLTAPDVLLYDVALETIQHWNTARTSVQTFKQCLKLFYSESPFFLHTLFLNIGREFKHYR